MSNENLFFDETLVQGSKEEVDAKKLILLKNAKCSFLVRSITVVLTAYVGAPCSPVTISPEEAPDVFCNATFVWWCFGKIGVHLTPRAATQRKGLRDIVWGDFQAGDIICFALPNMRQLLHGVMTESDKLVYACPSKRRVVERPFEDLSTCAFYGTRKILPRGQHRQTTVLRLPAGSRFSPTRETVQRLLSLPPPIE